MAFVLIGLFGFPFERNSFRFAFLLFVLGSYKNPLP